MDLGFKITYEDKGKFQIVYADGSKERSSPTDYLLYQLLQGGNSLPVAPSITTGVANTDKEPEEEPAPAPVELVEPVEDDTETLLRINSATVTEVDSLPKIGASSAEKIVTNRGDGYADLDDLKARSGVTHLDDAEWDAIAKLITFE